jgi:hypothetical protein
MVVRKSANTVGEEMSDSELLEALGDSLVWIELRMRLGYALRADADKGDDKAIGQLTFLSKHWPTGSAPREKIFAKLRRDNNELSAMLRHATETLLSMNVKCPDFVDRLIRSGIEVPEHWSAA